MSISATAPTDNRRAQDFNFPEKHEINCLIGSLLFGMLLELLLRSVRLVWLLPQSGFRCGLCCSCLCAALCVFVFFGALFDVCERVVLLVWLAVVIRCRTLDTRSQLSVRAAHMHCTSECWQTFSCIVHHIELHFAIVGLHMCMHQTHT